MCMDLDTLALCILSLQTVHMCAVTAGDSEAG